MARDTCVLSLAKNLSMVASEVKTIRFSVEGATGVTIIMRAASGTPTVDIGYYSFDSARSSTQADFGLTENGFGVLATSGRTVLVASDATTVFGQISCPIGCTEMDVQLTNAVTGLNIVAILNFG